MGLWDSVQNAAKKATIEFKKINVGHEIRREALKAVDRFESPIPAAGDALRTWWDQGIGGTLRKIGKGAGRLGKSVTDIPDTVDNVNKTANMTQTLVLVTGAIAIGAAVYFIARKR